MLLPPNINQYIDTNSIDERINIAIVSQRQCSIPSGALLQGRSTKGKIE